MADATWPRTGLPFGHAKQNHGRGKSRRLSRTKAMRQMGAVVYAARLADGTIKIGHTENFEDRMRYLAHHTGQAVELLAFRAGSRQDEQDLHATLSAHRIDGLREYYHPDVQVLSLVNKMRGDLGLQPVAA